MAAVYYQQMVHHGKNHKQAMGAVMSHVGARVFKVLREDRPYELKDTEGKPITNTSARLLILARYHVPEDIRQQRRKGNRKRLGMLASSVREADLAPQTAVLPSPRT